MGNRITIQDIADVSGISKSTFQGSSVIMDMLMKKQED